MNAQELIHEAYRVGFRLSAEGEKLRVQGPLKYGKLAKLLIQNKAEVIALLAQEVPHSAMSVSGDGDETSPITEETGVSSPGSSPDRDQWPCRKDEPVQWGSGQSRRLVGNNFPPMAIAKVPPTIVSADKILCPLCGLGRVLPELRMLTRGLCYTCWESGGRT